MKYILGIIGVLVILFVSVFVFTIQNQRDIERNNVIDTDNNALVLQKEEPSIYSSWKWTGTTDYQGALVRPQDSKDFVLTITPEGKITSTTDCNNVQGSIVINEEVVSVGSLSATEMACEGEILETVYINDLARITSYKIENNVLIFNLIKDIGVMRFERVEG